MIDDQTSHDPTGFYEWDAGDGPSLEHDASVDGGYSIGSNSGSVLLGFIC